MSLTAISSIILQNSQDRLHGDHFHMILEGKPQTGKSFIAKEVKSNQVPETARQVTMMSRKSLSTDRPQNGGTVVMDEPADFFTQSLKKMSSTSKNQASEMRSIMSSSELNYDVFEFVDVNGVRLRVKRTVNTPLQICILLTANQVFNKTEALGTRFFHFPVYSLTSFQTVDSMARNKNMPDNHRAAEHMKTLFHELNSILAILNIATSTGIIQAPMIGIMADVLRGVLTELDEDGVENCNLPRNFDRVLMVMTQLIFAGPVIKRYFMTDDIQSFHYEDLASLEKEFYATTETLMIAMNHLSEQYINSVQTVTILTLVRKFYHCQISDFALTDEELYDANKYAESKCSSFLTSTSRPISDLPNMVDPGVIVPPPPPHTPSKLVGDVEIEEEENDTVLVNITLIDDDNYEEEVGESVNSSLQ